jgi:hypothetical protein
LGRFFAEVDSVPTLGDMADWIAELRMSACRWVIPFNVVLNRIKQHFELPKVEFKITFDGWVFR